MAMASANDRPKAVGRSERNRGMPDDAVGRGLDDRPIWAFVGGGGALELLSARRGLLHHRRRTLHRAIRVSVAVE